MSSRLSENSRNSSLSLFWVIAWTKVVRGFSVSENSWMLQYSLFAISPMRELLAWARDSCRLSENSLAWARLTTKSFECLYPMIDWFTFLKKHEVWWCICLRWWNETVVCCVWHEIIMNWLVGWALAWNCNAWNKMWIWCEKHGCGMR